MKEKPTNKPTKVSPKKRWWVIYLIMGVLWYLGQNFNKTTYDGFVILIIAILAGFSYYPLREKIKIKNETIKGVITIFIIYFGSAFLMGFFTRLF